MRRLFLKNTISIPGDHQGTVDIPNGKCPGCGKKISSVKKQPIPGTNKVRLLCPACGKVLG